MTDIQKMPKLRADLDAIAAWRTERTAGYDDRIQEIAEEDERLQERLAEIKERLAELTEKRQTLQEEFRSVPEEVSRRSHEALLEALEADRLLLEARAAALTECEQENRAALEKRFEEPEIAAALEEYDKFKEVEPVLGSLPPSYRQVVLDHHAQLKERLAPIFELAQAPPDALDVDSAPLGLVASVDLVEDRPTAFALFLPVDYQVYRGWADRQEDLASKLAYRIVSVVASALEELGASDAPLVYHDFHGCLSIQVWLDDHELEGDVQQTVEAATATVLGEAGEVALAKLVVQLVWVDPSVIGPEDEEEGTGEPDTGPQEGAPEEEEDDSGGSSKPVEIVLKRGGSDRW